jgi:uncharacterized coiled-coil DUF342 family protein
MQEFEDEVAATKSRADEAKATMDEANEDLVDAKDAALNGQRDATSADDMAPDAKNAVDSMTSSIADGV